MTMDERRNLATLNHKAAIDMIDQLIKENRKLRMTANSRLRALKKLAPETYGAPKERTGDSYHMWRVSMGG